MKNIDVIQVFEEMLVVVHKQQRPDSQWFNLNEMLEDMSAEEAESYADMMAASEEDDEQQDV